MKILVMLVASMLAIAVVGCSDDSDTVEDITSTSGDVATGGDAGFVIEVQEAEFDIEASTNVAQPGLMTFSLTNEGDLAHQFIVLETELPAEELPLNEDTGQVDLESAQLEVLIAQEAFDPGEGPDVSAELGPGHYVFICNLTGHYQRGMQYNFVVAEP